MTSAVTMTTNNSATSLHRRHILDAIRKRLNDRMSITSPTSDDEYGDAKQIRLETTQDKTPHMSNDAMATTCWKPAPISADCLKQQHNAEKSVYQQLLENSISHDRCSTSNMQCCRPVTSVNIDQLLAGDVSSLCDVTVAAAACSLLQAVGRIHCRDCMQLKAKQECSSPVAATSAADDVTCVSRTPSFARPTTAVTSSINSGLSANVVAKQTNVKREIIIKNGNTDAFSSDNQHINRTKAQNDNFPHAVLQAVSTPSTSIPHPSAAAAVAQPRHRLQLSSAIGPNLMPQLRPILTTLNVATKLQVPRPPSAVSAKSNIVNTSDVTATVASATTAKTVVSSSVFSSSPLIVSASGHSPNHLTIFTAGQTAVTNVVAPVDEAAARRIRIESMTVAKLRAECRRLRLPITGPKPNLVRRLVQNTEAFKNDDTSTTQVSNATCTTALSTQTLTTSSILQSVLSHPSQVSAAEPTTSPRLTANENFSTPQVDGAAEFLPVDDDFQSNAEYNAVSNQNGVSAWFAGLPDVGARLPAVVGQCSSDGCNDLILKSPASLNHATTRVESVSPTVGGPLPPQNQDSEQLSLWQSQQKLIEELRRQLEQSRRAIVEARLQHHDSPMSASRDASFSAVDELQVDRKLCHAVAKTARVPQLTKTDNDSRCLLADDASGNEPAASVVAAGEVCFNVCQQTSAATIPKNSEEKDSYYQWNDEIADLLNECQQTDAGQMLDVDDWAGINFQWNDVEAASDMGVTDSKPHSSEPEMMDNLPANNARTKKQLTLEINAAAGQVVPDSDDLTWASSPLALTPNNAVDSQWSWWEWDDFLTPENNLPETPGTDSGSSCVGWDSDGATHSPPPRGTERHLANAAESLSYARRDLLLSMSSSRH